MKNVSQKLNFYLLGAHLILLLLQVIFWDFIIDDAFISFRYARNFYDYGQIAFNKDETPVEGYSNFLWVILIFVGFFFNIDPILFSKILGMTFCHLSVIVLYKLSFLINKDKKWSNLIILFYVCTPNIALWSVGGLETTLFLLLLLISIYFFLIDITKRKEKLINISPFFFVLLSLTRHEGAILYAVTFSYFIFIYLKSKILFKPRNILKITFFGITYLILYLPYFIWRVHYYNNILPHTFKAKKGNYELFLFITRILFFLPLVIYLIPLLVLVLYNIKKNYKEIRKNSSLGYLLIIIFVSSLLLLLVRSWMPGFRFTVHMIPLIYLFLP